MSVQPSLEGRVCGREVPGNDVDVPAYPPTYINRQAGVAEMENVIPYTV